MEATLIRKYLLGEVSDADRLTFEERLMADQGTYDELLTIENELTDDYLTDQLSATERRDFEEYFLLTHSRQEKLRFAKVMREHLLTHSQSKPSTERGRKSPLFAFFPFQNRVLSYSVAIAAMVFIVGISWFIWRSFTNSRGPRSAVTLTLAPGLTRNDGTGKSVSIPSNVDAVRVQLMLADDGSYKAYIATLQSIDGRLLATQRPLSSELIDGRRVVIVDYSSGLLPAGDYRIKLSGVAVEGDVFELASYYFKVLTR